MIEVYIKHEKSKVLESGARARNRPPVKNVILRYPDQITNNDHKPEQRRKYVKCEVKCSLLDVPKLFVLEKVELIFY